MLGVTFKENIPDLRNCKVVDLVRELENYGQDVRVQDPLADPEETRREFGLTLTPPQALTEAELVVAAIPHASHREKGWTLVRPLLAEGRGVVVDLKGVLPREECPEGVELWSL